VAGERLYVTDKKRPDWWIAVNDAGDSGRVPSNFLAPSSTVSDYEWYHGPISYVAPMYDVHRCLLRVGQHAD
jgi:hypothetical protein